MVNAGASIEAFLKLDASGFNTGIETAVKSVASLKESMIDMGTNTTAVMRGLDTVSKVIGNLTVKISTLSKMTKAVENFHTFALALEHMATAAQRLGNVTQSGSVGISAMTEVMEIWRAGVESAEAPIINLTQSVRNLGNATRDTSSKLSASQQTMRQQFQLLATTIDPTIGKEAEAKYITQQLRNEYNLTGLKLVEVRNQLLQTTQAVSQYNSAIGPMPMTTKSWANALSNLGTSFTRVGTTLQRWKSLTDAIVNSTTQNLSTGVNRVNTSLKNLSTNVNSSTSGMSKFSSALNSSTGGVAKANTGVRQYGSALRIATKYMAEGGAEAVKYRLLLKGVNLTTQDNTNTIMRQSAELRKNAVEKLRAMGYTGRLSAEEGILNSKTNQTTSALQRQSSASRQATASTNAQTTATNRLGRAMSSLRMIGTMVASMMVYNFAHNLIKATRETVNAKSEMEGYFKMLHFSQKEVDGFNSALDDTVSKFKRINKYSLGETISSIGVEFNLSMSEMKKAMPVVSMITSEYLRAGRNVNEASLAVKDILQGEFQRLSRETGVKGDQLKEAGWSGDKKDVMGLLEALDKVGKSRNWDVFVEKANSLNDAVLILQNRFGEWSAEMVNVVQPTILSVFNTLLVVGGHFGSLMSGAWEWLNGEGIANDIVRWTGLATAIGTVVTALVHYRTGANLTQMVQMGLRGSITATVFGLKAEEVATYGSRNAILSRITSIKAETVAEIGGRKAILSKIIGLNAEKVAQFGVRGAILESAFAKEYETAVQNGANVSELEAIALHYKSMHSRLSTTQAIFAHVLGLEAETVAEKGTIVALAQRIAQSPIYIGSLEAEEVAELSTAEAALILAGTLTPLIAIFVGLAVAVYGLVKPLMDASAEMKSFNNLVNDGDNIIKEHKKTMDSLTNSVNALTEKRDKYTEGSKKWKRANDKLTATQKDLTTATQNYENSIKAVEMARSRQTKYEDEKSKIAIKNQTNLADAYIKAGISSQEAYEMASHELNEAEKGAEQLRSALQMIEFKSKIFRKKNPKFINMLDQYGLSDDKIKEYGKNLSEAQYKIIEGMDKFMTSDDLLERIGGWFEMQQGQFEQWWTELNAYFEVRDWDSIRDKLWEGFNYILDLTPLGSAIRNLTAEMDKKGLVGAIMDSLFGEGDSDGAWDMFADFMYNMVFKPVGDWWNWFWQDPIAHLQLVRHDLSVLLAKFLFGKNSEGKPLYDITDKWMNDNVITPLGDYIRSKLTLQGLAEILYGISPFDDIIALLFGSENSDMSKADANFTDWLNNFNSWMNEELMSVDWIGVITTALSGIGGFVYDAIVDAIFGGGENDDGLVLGSTGKSSPSLAKKIDFSWLPKEIVDSITNGFQTYVGSINIVTIITSLIPSDASGIYQWVMDNIINPLVDGIKVGVLNTPVLGSVADLLGFGDDAESEASEKGQGVGSGFTSGVQTGIAPLDGIINTALGGLNLDGITAQFNTNAQSITTTASSTATNVSTSFSNMKNNQKTSLDSMALKNKTAFDDMKNKTSGTLLNMRDTTSQITSHVGKSFGTMKDNILSASNKLKTGSSNDFNALGSVIRSFYLNIQNPASWSASNNASRVAKNFGSAGVPTRTASARKPLAGRKAVRRIGGKHGAGINPYTNPSRTMSIKDLMNMVDVDEKVPIEKFLAMFSGGFGSWDFSSNHRSYIKNRAYTWDTAPATIQNIGQVGHGYKVDRWKTGRATFTWDDFMATAQDVFSAIPYKFYYDSEWKGNWVNALLSGATNCSDGSDALIALARVFGFDGYKQHTTLKNGVGHFFAIINGHKMDTTNFQNHGSWSPLGGAGIPTRTASHNGHMGETQGKTVNITVSMDNATIYGVEDLDSRIQESVQKGLQEEFNDPYTVAI